MTLVHKRITIPHMGYLNTTLIKKATMYAENAGNVGSYTGGSYTGATPASSGAGMSGSGFTGATPASSGAVAPSHAPAPAAKPINYARRTWDSARSLGRNAMGMGRQGWQWAKALARRNPKLAALLAIGGSLTGGAMLGSAASSGRPPVQQHDVNNPYAGFTTPY